MELVEGGLGHYPGVVHHHTEGGGDGGGGGGRGRGGVNCHYIVMY